MDPLRPKPTDAHEHFQSPLEQIRAVECVADVVVDGKGNGSVAVNLFKGDFPLVVALFSVHRHHGIERGAPLKAELLGIFDRLVELAVPVGQQLATHLGFSGAEVERQTVSLGVPIGAAPVLFACKAFGANIQAFVLTRIGLMEVKDVKADSLLSRYIAFDPDVAQRPFRAPGRFLFLQQGIKTQTPAFRGALVGLLQELIRSMVERAEHRAILAQYHLLSRLNGHAKAV